MTKKKTKEPGKAMKKKIIRKLLKDVERLAFEGIDHGHPMGPLDLLRVTLDFIEEAFEKDKHHRGGVIDT